MKRGDASAKPKLAEAKDRRNQFAVEEYGRRVKERPTELPLKYKLGEMLIKVERYDEAIAELQKSAGDPRYGARSRLALGKSFAAKGMPDMAVKELEKARQGLGPQDDIWKDVTFNLAYILEKTNKKDKAAAEYEKIVEADIGYKGGEAMKRLEALKGAEAQ